MGVKLKAVKSNKAQVICVVSKAAEVPAVVTVTISSEKHPSTT